MSLPIGSIRKDAATPRAIWTPRVPAEVFPYPMNRHGFHAHSAYR